MRCIWWIYLQEIWSSPLSRLRVGWCHCIIMTSFTFLLYQSSSFSKILTFSRELVWFLDSQTKTPRRCWKLWQTFSIRSPEDKFFRYMDPEINNLHSRSCNEMITQNGFKNPLFDSVMALIGIFLLCRRRTDFMSNLVRVIWDCFRFWVNVNRVWTILNVILIRRWRFIVKSR